MRENLNSACEISGWAVEYKVDPAHFTHADHAHYICYLETAARSEVGSIRAWRILVVPRNARRWRQRTVRTLRN